MNRELPLQPLSLAIEELSDTVRFSMTNGLLDPLLSNTKEGNLTDIFP